MTQTSTDVVPAFRTGRIALRDHEKTLVEVAADLIGPEVEHEVSTEMVPFPPVKQTPILTDETRQALAALPEVFGSVIVTERRTLTGEEIAAAHKEREVVKTVADALTGRADVIGDYIRHHVDVDAEERGVAVPKTVIRGGHVIAEATPRDAAGHYILASKGNPTRVNIPETNEAFSLEYRAGRDGGVVIDSNRLLDLYEAGEITRQQYLSLTREVRVFDEDRATKAILKDESLLAVIQKVTVRVAPTKPGTSLFIRKAK